MMSPVDSAILDLSFVAIHQKFFDEGKTREDACNYIENESNINIMNIGMPAFDLVS